MRMYKSDGVTQMYVSLAECEGHKVGVTGGPETHCPYGEDTTEHSNWFSGFFTGEIMFNSLVDDIGLIPAMCEVTDMLNTVQG